MYVNHNSPVSWGLTGIIWWTVHFILNVGVKLEISMHATVVNSLSLQSSKIQTCWPHRFTNLLTLYYQSSSFMNIGRVYMIQGWENIKKAFGWKKLAPKRKSKTMLALNLAKSKRRPISFLLGDHWSMFNWKGAGRVASKLYSLEGEEPKQKI